MVYKLAKALKTTVAVLLGEADPSEASERDQVFFRNYEQLKPETKKRLSRIMDVLMEDESEGDADS